MGDSITAGFAADAPGNSRTTNNTITAWCAQTAMRLDAEWSVLGHSGQGMYSNLNGLGQIEYGHVITMFDEYQWTLFPSWSAAPLLPWDYNPANGRVQWNFADIPDAVIFAIGTNDYITAAAGTGSAALVFDALFEAKYHEFLDTVREHYPVSLTTIFVHGIIARKARRSRICHRFQQDELVIRLRCRCTCGAAKECANQAKNPSF